VTKAAVFTANDSPLELMDLNLMDPKAGEVRIALGASGVCHSDISVINGTLPIAPPAVLGHEGAGTVVAVGEGVTNVAVGDHVVISWVPQCGTCYTCSRGQGELCETGANASMFGSMLDFTSRFTMADGTAVAQMSASGTFSEETVVPAISVVKIPNDMPFSVAALIGCGVLTGFGAAYNTANIREGDNVVVIGAGGVGLNTIQGAKYRGAGKIIAIDMVAGKLENAKGVGATDVIDASQTDAGAAVLELTEGRGADVAFEVIGLPATIRQAFDMTRKGGEAVIVGVPRLDQTMEFNPGMDFVIMEKTLKGCWYGGANVHQDVPMLVDLYQSGGLKLDELVSNTIKLEQVNEAMDAMGQGNIARSVIVY
jgi:NDMA-dependent alcohol dehydrogenase